MTERGDASAGPGVPDRVTLAAFGGASLIGGMNFVAVRFSNRELPPYFGAGARFAIAALILLAVVRLRRIPLPRGISLAVTLVYGVLSFAVVYSLAYWALQPDKLPAGIGAVVFAATPLLALVLVAAHRIERVRAQAVLGSVLAIGGIAILAGGGIDGAATVPILPLVAMLIAALAAAEAGVLLKRYPPIHPLATNAVAMAVGAALLLGFSAVMGESWVLPQQASTITAVAYLAVLGSVGLFGLFLFTLARWTASAVAYMTALFPVVAMAGGAIVAGEAITLNGVVGGVVVLTGLYIGALMPRRVPPGMPPPATHAVPARKVVGPLPQDMGCG